MEGEEVVESQPRNPLPAQEILKSVSIEGGSIFWATDAEEDREEGARVLESTTMQLFMYLEAQSTSAGIGRVEAYIQVDDLRWKLSTRQLVSMASFFDDLATWKKRSTYGSQRPERWKTHFERKVMGHTRRGDVSWAEVWKYAIRSVLQVWSTFVLPLPQMQPSVGHL